MTDRLTPQREAEIAARAEAATPGPWCTDSWEIYQGAEYQPGLSYWIGETCRADEDNDGRADAQFVAHARTDVPALLAELAAVRKERDEARAHALRQAADAAYLNVHSSAAEGVRRWLLHLAEAAEAPTPHSFDPEYQGVSDAKRRLARCKRCSENRFAAVHAGTEAGR